jgi:hypothetical protein
MQIDGNDPAVEAREIRDRGDTEELVLAWRGSQDLELALEICELIPQAPRERSKLVWRSHPCGLRVTAATTSTPWHST